MSVDDRIVAMKFDNAAFEQKIAGTIQSLDKLNQSLNFTNSTRGMDSLAAASRSVDLSPMGSSVDGISAKFIALATVGIAALSNLVNKAVNAGINIAKAFSIAPVMQGFNEYETNLNAIQTTLANTASKGTNLEQVNAALQELNLYSDKTIYNFSEMAKNIGTFTAAGVDLDRATASIKGIANLAALSGSNSQQASTAMYQLSQAISSGSVKLMDWNSVVNAGIGGEAFKTALFETGKALGTLKNVPMDQTFAEWEKANGSFRNSLSESGGEVDDVGARVAKATKDAQKQVASARKAQADSAASGAESIKRAEESKTKAFENATKSINTAVESQKRAIESAAKNNKDAIDAVTAAQERLKEALKPQDAEDMQAATDSLTSAQLDQKALAKDIAQAEREQKAAVDAVAKAKASAAKAKTPAQSKTGARRVADAEAKLLELTDALTRARIQQNTGIRSLHDAEEGLAEAKAKGSEADKNVIDARENLANAEKNVIQIKAEGIKSELDAAENLRDVEKQAAESRIDAIKSVSAARKQAAESDIAASERVADAVESAAERIKSANADSGGGPKPGWLTDKVLTQTLSAFTGDLTKKQLIEKGYTEQQADELLKIAKLAQDAAVIVKTFKQLRSTVKESIGSGWAQTSQLIVGDFEEAKVLFTGINDFIGGMVQRSTDARNDVLTGWKELGGRDTLIQGLKDAVGALGGVLRPIKEAFREIFPRKTAEQLFEMTKSFAEFMKNIKPSPEIIDKIKRIFAGLFAVVEIGWTILKGLLGVIVAIVKSIFPAGGALLGFAAKIGDMLVKLNEMLVGGGKIKDFFAKIAEWIQVPSRFIQQFIDKIGTLFNGVKGGSEAEESIGKVTGRLDQLRESFAKLTTLSPGMQKFFDDLQRGFDEALIKIKEWFSKLGSRLAEFFKPGDFDAAVDVINVGLLGGILLLLRKFVKKGLKLDFGGILEKASGAIDMFTNKMKVMQTNVKADTLMKIAIAVGILAASLLVLSLIDSVSLTKALAGMAVGFAQLVGVMVILAKIGSGPKGAITIGILAAAMIAMSSAMIILAVALKILSTIDPGDMAKALVGLGVSLGILVTAMMFMSTNAKGLIAGSIAMIAMSTALVILAGALKLFATMSWTELAKGLAAVAVGLGIIVIAMKFMPVASTIAAGLAMIPLAIGITILAGAVQLFALMSWGDMLKGMVGMAAALLIIAGTMQLMPLTLPLTAAGMLILAVALTVMAGAVLAMGSMELGTLAKGIGAIAAMLVILAIGMALMTGAMAGALALTVVSVALLGLAFVLKTIGELGIGTLLLGLAGIAAVLFILAVAAGVLTPVIPALFALGVALGIIGGAFALFGLGAMLVAKAFELLAKAGLTGVNVIIAVIKRLIAALPEFIGQLASSLIEMAQEILAAFPLIVKLVGAFLMQLLNLIIALVPKIAEAFGLIISAGLKLIREKIPEFLATGRDLLLALLKGIRDNIGEITTLAVDIVINFAKALTDNVSKLIDSAVTLLTSFLTAISERVEEIVDAGLNILTNLLKGISDNIGEIVKSVTLIVTTFITELGKGFLDIAKKGAEVLADFIQGISDNIETVLAKGKEVALKFIEGLADKTIDFTDKAAKLLVNFLNGMAEVIRVRSPEINAAFKNLVGAIADGIISGLESIPVIGSGVKVARDFIAGFTGKDGVDEGSPSKVMIKIGENIIKGLAIGISKDDMAKNSAVVQAERIVKTFHESLSKVPDSIIGLGELNPIITPVLDLTKVQSASKDISQMLGYAEISPNVSYQKARLISTTTELESAASVTPVYTGPSEVTFEQNIYSPEALSTNDIYRNTKSQIALVKEELGIS